MARADSGGFDLVLAISPEYLRDKLDDLLPDRFDPKVSFDWDWDAPGPVNIDAHIGLTAHLTLTIEDVIVQPGPDGPRVQVGTTTGVWFEWDDVTLIEHKVLLGAGRWPKQGALDGSDPDELRLVATLAGNLTSAGHVVQISGLTAHLGFESGSASDIPGVAALLAAVNAPPDWLIPDKLEELVAAIAGWIARLPQSFADRLTDLLPDALPAVAMPFGNVRFTSVGTDVLALASMSGTGGDPHAVVRSPIRRNASGEPTGPLGLVVANALMLRTAREGLGFLPDAGWHAPHPCHWRSMDRLTTVQEIEVYLSWVLVSIDEAGAMRIDVRFGGGHSSGGFGLSGGATFAVTLALSEDEVGLKLEDPHLTHLDLWFSWWMYALMGVGGGPLGVLVLGLIDAFAGGDLAAALSAALTDRFPNSFTIDPPDTGLMPQAVSRVQPDSEWQFASVLDSPPVQIPVSRAHDLVLQLVDT